MNPFPFIGAGLGAILFIIGLLLLFSKKARTIGRGVPVAKAFDPTILAIGLLIVGFMAGGIGIITGYASSVKTATIGGVISPTGEAVNTVGSFDLRIHDGISNASTTTEDYYNDEETVLTFYSADASLEDGEEFSWNITIERALSSEDAVVTVSCNIPDKELSGVTADNIAEKTSGQVDLDINDAGRHSDDNTVYRKFGLAEGDIDEEVEIAFDQEETYHDGMADLDDYVDIVCTVSDESGTVSDSVTTRIYANS